MAITLKTTPAEIDGMRTAGRLASEVLDMLTPHVVPGVTTDALDKLAHDMEHDFRGTGVIAVSLWLGPQLTERALIAAEKDRTHSGPR